MQCDEKFRKLENFYKIHWKTRIRANIHLCNSLLSDSVSPILLTYPRFTQPVPLLDQTTSSNKRKKERKKDYGPGIKFTSRSFELFDATYTTKAKERFNESFQKARMEMCANEEHREISFHFGCRVFVLWQNTNRNRMGFHIETEPFPRWLRLFWSLLSTKDTVCEYLALNSVKHSNQRFFLPGIECGF